MPGVSAGRLIPIGGLEGSPDRDRAPGNELEGLDLDSPNNHCYCFEAQAALGNSWAIAQAKPAISLAIAILVTLLFFPLAIRY